MNRGFPRVTSQFILRQFCKFSAALFIAEMNLLRILNFNFVASLLHLVSLSTNGFADVDLSNVDVEHHDSTVVCFVALWGKYRADPGGFLANSFNPKLCTHVVYSFASLHNETSTIVSKDPKGDMSINEGGLGGYSNYVELKEKHSKLKVLLAIGGYEDGVQVYSELVADEGRRKIFVESVVKFIKKYGFDGLDVSWRYPGDTDRGGKAEDKANFPILLKELNEAFKNIDPSWILTISIAAGKHFIDNAYDFDAITKYVLFMNIMAMDCHGQWEKKTGFNAPLYPAKDRDKLTNVRETVAYLIKRGVRTSKLVLGIPLYAQTFTLDNYKVNYIGAPANEPGPQGNLTQVPNFMIFLEVCLELAKPGWKVEWSDEQRVPYARKRSTWISFEDERSVTEKVRFALSKNLKGVMLYSIDMDDASANCRPHRMPLLSTVNKVFADDYAAYNNVHEERTSGAFKVIFQLNELSLTVALSFMLHHLQMLL